MNEEPPLNKAVSLLLTNEAWRSFPPHIRRWVDPSHVLTYPWNSGRIKEALAKLEAAYKAPPAYFIKVMILVPRGNKMVCITYYLVTDGNARTIAAKILGKKVLAEISGVYELSTENYYIWSSQLWYQKDIFYATQQSFGVIPAEVISELEKLGVANRDKGTNPWADDSWGEDYYFETRNIAR